MPDTMMDAGETVRRAEPPQLRSLEIAKLAGALAAAQANFSAIPKNREVTVRSQKGDYKFKYATLDGILSATVPALAEQGLALVQAIVHDDGGNPGLETTLYHSSGEWMRNITPMFLTGRQTQDGRALPPSNQELGSAQSYARRYGISALLCVAADEDDDGNIADGNHIENSRDVPYRGGGKGTSGAGRDFRPAGPRRQSSWGEGGKQGVIDEAQRDGLMGGAKPKPLPGTPAQRTTNAAAGGNAIKRVEWTTASIAHIKTLPTKEALGDWWRENKERLDIIEGALPTEYERLVVAYDAAMDAAVAQVA